MRRNAGTPNKASASRKDMMKPDTMAGMTRGSVTCRPVRQELAPRLAAASSISEDISSRAPDTKVKV